MKVRVPGVSRPAVFLAALLVGLVLAAGAVRGHKALAVGPPPTVDGQWLYYANILPTYDQCWYSFPVVLSQTGTSVTGDRLACAPMFSGNLTIWAYNFTGTYVAGHLDITGTNLLATGTVRIVADGAGCNLYGIWSTDPPGPVGQIVLEPGYSTDSDGDGMTDQFECNEPCLDPYVNDLDFDPDGDGLTTGSEVALAQNTDPCLPDTDADGCTDGEEAGPNHVFGGQRNGANYFDFYDVTGDRYVDLSDTLLILSHFGHGPDDDPVDNLLDRDITDEQEPWRASASDTGVDLTDALNNLQSFGDGCVGSP